MQVASLGDDLQEMSSLFSGKKIRNHFKMSFVELLFCVLNYVLLLYRDRLAFHKIDNVLKIDFNLNFD